MIQRNRPHKFLLYKIKPASGKEPRLGIIIMQYQEHQTKRTEECNTNVQFYFKCQKAALLMGFQKQACIDMQGELPWLTNHCCPGLFTTLWQKYKQCSDDLTEVPTKLVLITSLYNWTRKIERPGKGIYPQNKSKIKMQVHKPLVIRALKYRKTTFHSVQCPRATSLLYNHCNHGGQGTMIHMIL